MIRSSRPQDDRFIVIVSGLPRSGTSLMMQILARAGWPVLCDDRRPADASNPRGYYEFDPVRGSLQDASWVAGARGHAVKVVHALLPGLPADPHYRVLLMRRPMDEVLASQDAMLVRMGHAASSPVTRKRLGALFARQLEETRRLLDARPCFEWIEVEHARLLQTPETEIARVAAFLDLELELELTGDRTLATLAACVEPSLHRERLASATAQESAAEGGKASRI